MKSVILAGGLGTRLREETEFRPKPMVPIGGKPILWHIMKTFSHHGHQDFVVCTGYRGDYIRQYIHEFEAMNSDFTVKIGSKERIRTHGSLEESGWEVTVADTGAETMTGGRLKRLQKYLAGERFMLTYGDGLSNIDINSLIAFHESHGKMVTMTAVRPTARFGELELDGDKVESFIEKPQLHGGWINGGFFVIEPEFLDLISDDSIMLEREPLELASTRGELMAYRHEGFWQCMDTKRDHDLLQSLLLNGAPWEAK
jgi:glucose-1-phosphate cytidylyltransferase